MALRSNMLIRWYRLLVAVLCAVVVAPAVVAAAGPTVGERAPDFHVTTFEGTRLSLSDLKPLTAHLDIPMARQFKWKYRPPDAVPMNYIVDRDGILRYAKAGAFTLEELNEILIPMLSTPASVGPGSPIGG